MSIGENILELRKKLGYTQKEFAAFLDIPQPSLSAYENNRCQPTIDVVMKIATKCNVSLDALCKKKYPVTVMFEEEEYKTVTDQAKVRGMKVEDYIKYLVIENMKY